MRVMQRGEYAVTGEPTHGQHTRKEQRANAGHRHGRNLKDIPERIIYERYTWKDK